MLAGSILSVTGLMGSTPNSLPEDVPSFGDKIRELPKILTPY